MSIPPPPRKQTFLSRPVLASWRLFLVVAVLFVAAARHSARQPHHGVHHGVMSWRQQPGQWTAEYVRRAWRDRPVARAVQRWDHAMFHRVNHDWDSPLFDRVMPLATDLGDGRTQIVLLLGVFAWASLARRKAWRATSLLSLLAVASAALAPVMKLILPRARPPAIFPTTDVLLVHPLYGGAFPSGHTLVSFAVATVIAVRHRWAVPWALGLAALVGVSRISVGVHWPVDVLGGATLGVLIGLLVLAWWRWQEARRAVAGGARAEAPPLYAVSGTIRRDE